MTHLFCSLISSFSLENLIGDINGNNHEGASPHYCSIIETKNESIDLNKANRGSKITTRGGSIFDAYVGQNWMIIDTPVLLILKLSFYFPWILSMNLSASNTYDKPIIIIHFQFKPTTIIKGFSSSHISPNNIRILKMQITPTTISKDCFTLPTIWLYL